MTTISAAQAISLAADILTGVGASRSAATRVATGLVDADLAGVSTHGISQLRRYAAAVDAGELDPRAEPVVEADAGGTALVRGNWTFGHLAADVAVDLAVRKARDLGVSSVALVECHHIGRLGEFVEDAARQGVILMIWAGGQGVERPAAVPFGGRQAALHTNPIAIGIPAGVDHPFVLDIATSVMSGLKVQQAADAGTQVPSGSIVDRDGHPTTDPNALANGGAHLPFGGHKGYGFMLAAEALGRIVTGADQWSDTTRGGPWLRHAGYLLIGVLADRFVGATGYERAMTTLFDDIRAIPPAPGSSAVLVPGDAEARARARLGETIDIAEPVYRWLLETAAASGVHERVDPKRG
jgi:LDH2 family malate/lactate/ureidoglycolate dehydrogenase